MIPNGTHVQISTTSEFAHQLDSAGNMPGIVTDSDGKWYHVKFPNRYENDYRASDLVIAGKVTNAAFTSLLKENY